MTAGANPHCRVCDAPAELHGGRGHIATQPYVPCVAVMVDYWPRVARRVYGAITSSTFLWLNMDVSID